MRLHELFTAIGEHFAAGFFRHPNETYLARHAHALSEVLTRAPLPEYRGTRLYPQGRASIWNPRFDAVFTFSYYYSTRLSQPAYELCRKKADAAHIALDPTLDKQLRMATQEKAFTVNNLRGWTHSVLNYERILHDGLDRYAERLQSDLHAHPRFCAPLLEVVRAIQTHIGRCETLLRNAGADDLADIFAHMAHHPAQNLRQAFVYFNYFWFIDDPDSAGRMDAVLQQYSNHNLSDDDIQAHFREFWQSFDLLGVWNVTFDTHLPWMHHALLAQRNLSRPGASALIDDDTSQQAWDDIFDSWLSGNTSPALYFRPNYYRGLDTQWNVRPEDFSGLSYGGCTELMIMGKSNVGSTDGDLHALNVLASTQLLHNSFDDFYRHYLDALREKAHQEVDRCQLGHQVAAMYQPNLIRTLFTEDCLDTHTEFNAGGARYNLGLIGVTGLSNAVNAIYNIRLAYDGQFSIHRLANALDDNFQNDPELLELLKATPKFGNDHDDIDALATRFIDDVFAIVRAESRPDRTYIPFINLFTTYAERGSYIPATADGRLAGSPVGDSFGAVQGTDHNGPTALLNSVTKPDQQRALGTPVLNLRLQRDMLATPQARALTKAMLMTYFKRGGLQVQVSVLDAEAMRDALDHPERHPHLMVRIGGYSEYFTRLSRPVQLEVIKRTEHAL